MRRRSSESIGEKLMRAHFLTVGFLLAGLAGCDGRAKILYLQPATTVKPPWSVASVVIPIEGREDIVGIVSKIASDLGLAADSQAQNRWWISVDERNTFTLSVAKEDKGYWTVSLLDWPTTRRSEQSLRAEQMIRSALRAPIKSPLPTSASVTPRAGAQAAPAALVAGL